MLRLPPRMEEVLVLVYGKGLKEVDVAEKLGISKQAVSKALREGRGRLAQIFLSLAQTLNADTVKVDIGKGCAVVKLRQLGMKAYLIYVPGKGVRTLFQQNITCNGENEALCREVIEAAIAWGLIRGDSISNNYVEIINRVIEELEK